MLVHCADSHEQNAWINFRSTRRSASAERRTATQTVVYYIGHVFLQFAVFFHYYFILWPKLIIIPFASEPKSLFLCNLLVPSQSLRQWRLQQLIWDFESWAASKKLRINKVSWRHNRLTIVHQFTFSFLRLPSMPCRNDNICLIVATHKKEATMRWKNKQAAKTPELLFFLEKTTNRDGKHLRIFTSLRDLFALFSPRKNFSCCLSSANKATIFLPNNNNWYNTKCLFSKH